MHLSARKLAHMPFIITINVVLVRPISVQRVYYYTMYIVALANSRILVSLFNFPLK